MPAWLTLATRCKLSSAASIRDDAQARPLRIGCDHTRDGFDESCELARIGSREQEGVADVLRAICSGVTGDYNSPF